jgi:hypothetical protein
MKYIITEDQERLISHSKKINAFQNIINSKIEYIRESCESSDPYEDNYDLPNDLSPENCNDIEMLDRINVTNVIVGTRDSESSPNFVEVYIEIYYNNLTHYDFEDFSYTLRSMIENSVGIPIIIKIVEEINLSSSTEW